MTSKRMPARTLKALKGSITKWEKIVDGSGIDQGRENCPLCALFAQDEEDDYCTGCPVSGKTGKGWCRDSPYVAWRKARPKSPYFGKAATPELVELARAELEFLKSLLPKGKRS